MFATTYDLGRNESGKAPLKLVLSSCLLGMAVATTSPTFQANPMLGQTVNEVRTHLPETLDTITRAMRGD